MVLSPPWAPAAPGHSPICPLQRREPALGRGLTSAGPPGMTAAMRTGASPRSVRPKPASPRVTWTGPTSRQQFLAENTDRGPWGWGEGVSEAQPGHHSTPHPNLCILGQTLVWQRGRVGRGHHQGRHHLSRVLPQGPPPGQGWAACAEAGRGEPGRGAHQPVEDICHLHPGKAGCPDLWLLLCFR